MSKAIRVNGKRVRCRICGKKNATTMMAGVAFCNRCIRPFCIGLIAGRTQRVVKE